MTVIVLNFTRERVPSEEKETSFKKKLKAA